MSNEKLDTLIDGLCDELDCCGAMKHPFTRVLPWALFSIAYMSFVVLFLGVRDDLSVMMSDTHFLFENGLAAFIMVTATLASALMSVPDMRGKNWIASLPLTAAGIFVFWSVVRYVVEGITWEDIHWDHCLEGGAMVGILPTLALIIMLRKGATTSPVMMTSMNVLAVASLAYIGMRFVCVKDTVGHSGFVQVMPFIVIGLVLGLLSRKLYKW